MTMIQSEFGVGKFTTKGGYDVEIVLDLSSKGLDKEQPPLVGIITTKLGFKTMGTWWPDGSYIKADTPSSFDLVKDTLKMYKVINGVEVPVLEWVPSYGEGYLHIDLTEGLGYTWELWVGGLVDQRRLRRGLAYPSTPEGLEAIKIHAKALLEEDVE